MSQPDMNPPNLAAEAIPESPVKQVTAKELTVTQAEWARVTTTLSAVYAVAEDLQKSKDYSSQEAVLGAQGLHAAQQLAKIKHAVRGGVLTLAVYKAVKPTQDIRSHKVEHANGFSARTIDANCTVPFLRSHSLPYNVETHWLSQTLSFAGPYTADSILKTNPAKAGPAMLKVVNDIQSSAAPAAYAVSVAEVIIAELIDERNTGKIPLEKPQGLSIDETINLVKKHFLVGYTKNSPRLPQVAMYAIYQCITPAMERYKGLSLQPLERMKAANRKSGSVGDVDINKDGLPFEAVEIKFGIQINRDHVAEAIQKIKTASVQRYLILSTVGIADGEIEVISDLQNKFRKTNGCEIIVNGILDTIKYYLRLIDTPSTFINRYTALVEADEDLGYEHRLGWNSVCAERHS